MMPMREVHLRRWHMLLLLACFTAWSVGYAIWSDHRVDAAETRITANTARVAEATIKAEVAIAQNLVQNQVRRELTALFCGEINKINERLRATVTVNRKRFGEALVQLGIDPLSPQGVALLEQALVQEAELKERFAPVECGALPGS